MKLCMSAINPKAGNKKKNIKKIEKIVLGTEADFYAFGEMAVTGYVCRDECVSLAEKEDGESLSTLQKLAAEQNCGIVVGMPIEEREGIIYNAAVCIQPDRTDIYKKIFLANFGPFEEKRYFTPGETIPTIRTPYGTLGICICYDLFFPELIKGLALKGADVILCISASPSTSRIFFEKVLPARAVENTVFLAYANLVGEQQGLTFWGGCQSYTPTGELIGRTEYFKEETTVHDIDFTLLREARIGRPTLRDTRAELFLDLYGHARQKIVFNERVKQGISIGSQLSSLTGVTEIELYGDEDVAFGIRLAYTIAPVSIHPVDEQGVRAIVRGSHQKEIRPEHNT